jgi:plastocyanin
MQEQSGAGVVGNAERDKDPFDVTILYTDDGFEPRDIAVAQGTRVRFLNQSDRESWPASNIHPTHSLYPEKGSTDCLGSSFDSCDALQKDDFYDFTFNYIGEWRFHDHLRGYHTGTITVTASTSTAQ